MNYKRIKDSKGNIIKVDLDDYECVSKFKWWRDNNNRGYITRSKRCKEPYLHRLVMNAKAMETVTFMNGDTLDCRKSNLQFSTIGQIQSKRKQLNSNNTSKHIGVGLHSSGKYQAYLKLNRIQMHLGLHDTIEEAVEARKDAEKQYYGKFAPNIK